MVNIGISTYRIDKIIAFFEFLGEFAVVFDGAFMVTALEPVVFNDWSDLGLELPSDM